MKQLEGKEAGLREETEETDKDDAPHPRSTIKDAHSTIKQTEAARARTGGGLKLPQTIEQPQPARRRRGAGAQEGEEEELAAAAAAGGETEGLMDEMEEEADSYEPSQVSSRMLTPLLNMLTHAHACSWTRRKRRVTVTRRKRRLTLTSPTAQPLDTSLVEPKSLDTALIEPQ